MPFLGMMLLTFIVWSLMYFRRIRFLRHEKVDLRTVDTPDKASAVIPDRVALPAHNFRNLLEAPVIFYAFCLFLFVTGLVDTIYLACAWLFFALRIVHSVIQCTTNRVMHRFVAYFSGAIVLWIMVLRAFFDLVATN